MQPILKNKLDDLKSICTAFGVTRLYAFGSAISGKFTPKSDIDFLISFDDKLTPEEYANNYLALHYQLRDLFKRDVDIVTERSLKNPYFIQKLNESKTLIYEA